MAWHGCSKGKRSFSNKNQYNLFCKKWVLNIFHWTILTKKKTKKKQNTISSKITTKNNFWGTWPFLRQSRRRTTEMSWTFSVKNGIPHTVHKFFLWKIPYRLNESKKLILGAHFPHIGGSIGPTDSKNNRTRIKRANFMKIISKIVSSCT